MIFVIDTNIIVSAALSGGKPQIVINWIISQPREQWVVSVEILEEYVNVLNRPKLKLTVEKRQEWLSLINRVTQVINVDINVNFPRDQKDAKFIACAIACQADFLITGDRDLNEVQTIGKTIVIGISDFSDLIYPI